MYRFGSLPFAVIGICSGIGFTRCCGIVSKACKVPMEVMFLVQITQFLALKDVQPSSLVWMPDVLAVIDISRGVTLL